MGSVRGSRPDLSGRCVWWASSVCAVHGAMFFKSPSAEASGGFL
ncbi:MAG: hypothetical protein JWP45_642 [Mucilaginibacter sp.]|nr:hypothetical protein [Mucilaginibacter sp.]